MAVAENLPCLGCGYDLHGLPPEGSCPECGTAIARSLGGDRLAAADARWLAGIARGQRLLGIGLTVAIGLWFLSFVAMMVGAIISSAVSGVGGGLFRVLIAIGGGGVVGGMIMATIGAFLLTRLEPRETLREAAGSTRQIARYGLLVAMAVMIVARLLTAVLAPAVSSVVSRIATLLVVVAITVAIVNVLRRLSDLAERMPDADLAARTTKAANRYRWVLPAPVVAMLIYTTLPPGTSATTNAVSIIALLCLTVFGLLLLGEIGSSIGTMRDYRRALTKCLDEARRAQESTDLSGAEMGQALPSQSSVSGDRRP